MSHPATSGTALFVLNFPAGTGYAWDTIERVMLEVIGRLAIQGIRSVVCRPPSPLPAVEDRFALAGIRVHDFDYSKTGNSTASTRAFCRLLRNESVTLLYLTDQPTWSFRYPRYRLAGVRAIVVHERTSGERTVRAPAIRLVKRLLHAIPGLSADRFIGISDFVVRRLIEVNGAPAWRVSRVYNGIDLSRFNGRHPHRLHQVLGLPDSTSIVFASGRAMPYKGIPVLLRAAALLQATHPEVHVAYAGDGPRLEEFRREAQHLHLARFHFLGKRQDIPDLLGSATIAVVPSVWAEAFGLTVVEAMAAGVPVVASSVGGIPELIDPEETGLLVPPGDDAALASSLRRLLDDAELRGRMGTRARETARARFSHVRVADELSAVLLGT